jgi:hypothetical protein
MVALSLLQSALFVGFCFAVHDRVHRAHVSGDGGKVTKVGALNAPRRQNAMFSQRAFDAGQGLDLRNPNLAYLFRDLVDAMQLDNAKCTDEHNQREGGNISNRNLGTDCSLEEARHGRSSNGYCRWLKCRQIL